MAGIGLVSPGVKVREVDLTVGRIDSISDQTGAIVGPFERGPVLEPLLIENEQDMIDLFGKPSLTDRQYEYWYTASNYLQYGGVLRVVRADGANLNNANVGGMPSTHPTGIGSTSSLKIKSFQDYQNNYEDATSYRLAARNPGSYANGMKVAFIDGAADQQLHVTPHVVTNISVGMGVTQPISGTIVGPGTTSTADGYLQGIVTGIGASTVDVKVTNRVSAAGTIFPATYTEDGIFAFTTGTKTSNTLPGPGVLFSSSSSTIANPDAGISTCATVFQVDDWYDNQFIQLKNGALQWKEIAEKPGTSGYSAARNGSNDELHIVVIDEQVQFLRSLHSYQRQMMQRTPLVMQSTTKILFQRTLITSLLESQLETEQSHLVL